jgi:hypothetical protein
LTRLKIQLWQTTQCAKIKNAHRRITVGDLVARRQNRFSLTKSLNPKKTMKKISSVPFSNPIPTNELFIHQTFIRKAKAKGLSEQEADSKFQALLKSGEIQEWKEQTENLFERTVKIYFRKKC